MKLHSARAQQQKPVESKSFMQKFKDKHSVISKQGLLKLLESRAKPQFMSENNQKSQKPNGKLMKSSRVEQIRLREVNSSNSNQLQKSLQKKKIDEIIKVRNVRKGSDSSISKSVQLNQLPPKLPKIQKSISTSIHLRKELNSSPVPKSHTDSIPKPIKKSSYHHIGDRKSPELRNNMEKSKEKGYNFELDKFALDHLDFLEKFQERIRKRETTPF